MAKPWKKHKAVQPVWTKELETLHCSNGNLPEPELEFVQDAIEAGWDLTKRGWPDFLLFKHPRYAVVEVKKHKGEQLKRSQLKIMNFLCYHGIKCYKWSPDGGFERIVSTQPKPYKQRLIINHADIY